MQFHSINRNSTFFKNDFVDAYYSGSLSRLTSYKPTLAALSDAIESRKEFSHEKRNLLVNELLAQYKESEIEVVSTKVGDHIQLLNNPNTFSITTGQQIHLGLGPLYVLYKILDVLAICTEAKKAYPKFSFVPIFWMASEDHDLEEIQSIPLFNKEFRWDTNQIGPVGRMDVNGIPNVFQEIENQFNLSEDQLNFISKCKEFYKMGTLSSSFRKLLHAYFLEEGLVILDGDSKNLKASVSHVLEDELRGKNDAALKDTSLKLNEAGFKPLLVTRQSNLFWISKAAGRSKIKIEKERILTEEGDVLCAASEVEEFVEKNAFNLSPNAALRPLYQELILPNLVYVGGGSEVRYWHQLLGIFANYNKTLPILHLRTSNVIVPASKLKALSLESLEDLFKSENELMSRYSHDLSKAQELLEKRKLEIEESLLAYNELFSENVSGKSINTRLQKITQRLDELHEYVKSELIKNGDRNSKLDKVLKAKKLYANPGSIQERNEHIIGFADVLGEIHSIGYSHFGFKNSQKINMIVTQNV